MDSCFPTAQSQTKFMAETNAIFCQKFLLRGAHLSLPNFLLFLFQKSRGDASNVVLGTKQQGPKILHELPCILSIQEACQVDLHHLAIRVLQHTHEWGREREKSIQPLTEDMISRRVRIHYSLLNYPYDFVGNIIKTHKIQTIIFFKVTSVQ